MHCIGKCFNSAQMSSLNHNNIRDDHCPPPNTETIILKYLISPNNQMLLKFLFKFAQLIKPPIMKKVKRGTCKIFSVLLNKAFSVKSAMSFCSNSTETCLGGD